VLSRGRPARADEPPGDPPSLRARDRFGNLIDPEVEYARGQILASARDERLRFLQAQRIIRRRLTEHGPGSIAIFTGNQRVGLINATNGRVEPNPDGIPLSCHKSIVELLREMAARRIRRPASNPQGVNT
jgi:hypothetical protein